MRVVLFAVTAAVLRQEIRFEVRNFDDFGDLVGAPGCGFWRTDQHRIGGGAESCAVSGDPARDSRDETCEVPRSRETLVSICLSAPSRITARSPMTYSAGAIGS